MLTWVTIAYVPLAFIAVCGDSLSFESLIAAMDEEIAA
jgi:hypothetical protein